MIKLFRPVTLVLLVLIVAVLIASTPKVITYKTQQDFQKGEAKGVSINPNGEILLAPQINEIFSSDLSFIWTAVAGKRGNIYAAGGNGGQVFKIDSDNNSSLIFEAPEVEVYALAIDGRNNLYIASSPEGKVYKTPSGQKVNPADAVFFDPDEIYIWSMVVDKSGHLFVATGDKGNIYKVDATGKSSLFYESGDIHIRKIILDNKGNLIAGTSDKGMVIRIDSGGKAFVLYDSPLVEITDLLQDPNGNIYAAAAGESVLPRQPRPGKPNGGDKTEASGESEAIDLAVQQISGGAGRSSKKSSALYRIDQDGTVTTFWTDQKDRIYSMTLDSGNLILGTGATGRLYTMTATGEITLLTDLDEMDITVLGRDHAGQIFAGTSNSGKLYRLDKRLNSSGEYLSDVMDAKVSSQWGSISWEAAMSQKSGIEFQSRSGNTEEPDKTWSSWSKDYTVSSGETISSPPARFLQMKATLTSKDGKRSPVLKQFSFSYLQKNVAPRVTQITLHPPGDYYPDSANHNGNNSHLENESSRNQSSFQNQSIGIKSFKKGYRSVSWISKDVNGDRLSYNLFYRGENESTWKILVEDFKGSVYSWDSELFPDGRFFVKISVSDNPSNPPALALSSEKVSQPFVVDNSGPKVSALNVRNVGKEILLSFFVEDEWTILEAVKYGLNAESWVLVYPVDGICDSKKEKFEIRVSAETRGTNTIVIKAKDALGNIGFGKSHFEL